MFKRNHDNRNSSRFMCIISLGSFYSRIKLKFIITSFKLSNFNE